jgi:hypothetical protein
MDLKKWFKYKVKKPTVSTILCIRFPFLYPRNRWTGLHYNNWRTLDFLKDIYAKYHVLDMGDNLQANGKKYYKKNLSGEHQWNEYWKKWWALPLYKVVQFYHDWILAFFHCIPTFTELDALDCGWKKAFGIQMCKDLRKQLLKEGNLFKFRITQLKEKWGVMELYNTGASNKVDSIIAEYQRISATTCNYCGGKATIITHPGAYMLPYCQECYNKYGSSAVILKYKEGNIWKYNKGLEEV